MSDHITDAIDSAHGDTLSPNAMRWTPTAPAQENPHPWEHVTTLVTRADLIADGDLIEAPTQLAREAGWTIPVALTRAAHADTIAWDHGPHQDVTGRWWDVLAMGALAARAGGRGPRTFPIARVPNQADATEAKETLLVLHIGPGDAGEPVITIATPDEETL